MRYLFIISFWGLLISVNLKAERRSDLNGTEWNIFKVECIIDAKDSSEQLFLDNYFQFLRKETIPYYEQYTYTFVADTLKKKTEKKEFDWNYKILNDNIIVNMGNGTMLIQKYKVENDSILILFLDKPLFFLSEFSPQTDSIKSMIKSISLKYFYKKGGF